MKMLHVITSVSTGGAQAMLCRLLSRLNRPRFEAAVVSLIDSDAGPIADQIRALGVPVRSLGMDRGVPDPLAVLRLARWLRQGAADVIQTWMYHADLIGGLAAKLAGTIPVVWGIHHTNLDAQRDKRSTIWTATVCARLSRWLPAQIVCCSEATRQLHAQLGYAADKMAVIPNGFDLALFKPDPDARRAVRQELGIPAEASLIGLVARFHPQKDHRNFLRAASILHIRAPENRFLLCGRGITWENTELVTWIEEAGIRDRCHLLGEQADIPRISAAFDVASTSASHGEAFPLVIGEAMACGVPCVVTDIGDSAMIVGETGVVVPPKDPQALADGWARLLSMNREERRQLGLAARQRIVERYSLERIAKRYEQLYESVVAEAVSVKA